MSTTSENVTSASPPNITPVVDTKGNAYAPWDHWTQGHTERIFAILGTGDTPTATNPSPTQPTTPVPNLVMAPSPVVYLMIPSQQPGSVFLVQQPQMFVPQVPLPSLPPAPPAPNGNSAEYVVLGCVPLILAAHCLAQSRQWAHLRGILATLTTPTALAAIESLLEEVWAASMPSKTVDRRMLEVPIFVQGAGAVPGIIADLRHNGMFQFRGVTYNDPMSGTLKRHSTEYSDVICKDFQWKG